MHVFAHIHFHLGGPPGHPGGSLDTPGPQALACLACSQAAPLHVHWARNLKDFHSRVFLSNKKLNRTKQNLVGSV